MMSKFLNFFSNKLNMTTSLSILIQTQGRDQNMVGASHSIDLSLTLAHDRWRGLWSYCIKKITSWKIHFMAWSQSQAGELQRHSQEEIRVSVWSWDLRGTASIWQSLRLLQDF